MKAVAAAIGVDIEEGKVRAEGDIDFRGTLAKDKTAPVGFKEIRVMFNLNTSATEDEMSSLMKLTERYCVVYQTLKSSPGLRVDYTINKN